MDELERPLVGGAGLLDAIESPEQVRAGRVQVVVPIELQPFDQVQRHLDLARLGDRGRLVELDHRGAGATRELAVEGCELAPVLGLVRVQDRDRGLEHVRAASAERQRSIELRPPGLDLIGVPERPVLIAQEHDLAIGEPGLAASVVDQHQRKQRPDLGLVGHQLGERSPEPDRLGGELSAPAVALVEDQVDDREHRGEPVGQEVGRGHPERDSGGPDLGLRAHQPLRHRRLRHEERAGDLVRLQPAQCPQRQRDLGVERQRGVTAGEDELESLVGDRGLVQLILRVLPHFEQAGLRGQRSIAADAVDRPVARGGQQPGARVVRRPVAGPALGGDGKRLLGGLLGELEVAEEADQVGEDAPPLVAEDVLERSYHSTIGRTSTAPPRRAAGMRAASSIAASRSSASNTR